MRERLEIPSLLRKAAVAMSGSRLRLPPFAALRAFYAAATHERFRDAAESLGVTESAISHQVKRLEEHVRAGLLDRSGGRARLTETGLRYLQKIEPALLQIQAATDEIMPGRGRGLVRLTLPPSLAANWLIPRLGGFERAHPEVDLQLLTSTRVVDLRRDQVDLAIRHGKGAWPGLEATFLLEEAAMPVCAPGYAGARESDGAGVTDPDIFNGLRLIVSANFPDEWEEWAKARKLPPPAMGDSVVLDAQEQALQLAEKGLGIAMGRRPVVDEWLQSGRLVAPFGGADPTGAAYYLCKAEDTALPAAARRAEQWLLEIASAWQSGDAAAECNNGLE
jgi:LysR family glycine cleavage system transcriptional activator